MSDPFAPYINWAKVGEHIGRSTEVINMYNAMPPHLKLACHFIPGGPVNDLPADSRFEIEELQLYALLRLNSQARGDLVRRAEAALKRIGPNALVGLDRKSNVAWTISNGNDDKWRYWRTDPVEQSPRQWYSGPDWTDNRNEATHFARREDAETWAHDDEEACFIRPVALDDQPLQYLVDGEMHRLMKLVSELGTENAKLRSGADVIFESRQVDPVRSEAARNLCYRVDRTMQAPANVWSVGDLLPLIRECGTFISFYAPEPVGKAGQLHPDPESSDAPKGAFMLPVDKRTPAEVLHLFNYFVNLNVRVWMMGANDHHHPIWEHVTINSEGPEPTHGPEWAYIQPLNRKPLVVLEYEHSEMMNAREAEERGG